MYFHSALAAIQATSELDGVRPFTLVVETQQTVLPWTQIVGTLNTDRPAMISLSGMTYQHGDNFIALTRQDAGSGHRLVEFSAGDRDAVFVEWMDRYALPSELFFKRPPADTRWGTSTD